jgi:hypothetical protein
MGRLTSTSGGRLKKQTSDLSTAEGLAGYARGLGLDEQVNQILDSGTPKLSFLQRLGKGLGSFNPAEAYLTGTEKGVGAGVLKYGTGIVKGIGSAIIGKDIEGERRYFSDVAEKYGITNGVAKFGIGFLGDVLLDPTTYFGGAIAKGIGLGVKTATEVGVSALSKVAPETATNLLKAGEGLSDAFGSLFKAGYKTQEGVVGDTMAFLGKKSGATKGLAESNLARLGTGILTPEQNAEVFTRLAGGKRLEFALRQEGKTAIQAGNQATKQVLEGATGQVKTTLEEQMARGAKFGQEVSGDEFYRSYFPFLKKDKVNSFITNTRGLRVGSEGYLKQFKNLLTNENMEQNVAKAFFTRETQVVTDRMTGDFLEGFVGKYGKGLDTFKTAEEAKNAGFELLRAKGNFGKEIGYIPQWDSKFIKDMFSPEFKSIDMLAKATGFDAVTSLFKRSVTGLFAPFHFRNYVSGHIQNFEVLGKDALNPKNINAGQKLALNTIKGIKGTGEYGKFLEPFMNRFGFSSFYKNEFDNALNTGQTLGEYEKIFSKGAMVKTIKTVGLSSDAIPFKVARNVGNFIELQQKGTAYITALGQGKSIKQALNIAEQAGFDYRVLTKFESQILRRIVPFYSFTRKNIELQLRTLGENPQRINQIIKLVENIGVKPTEEEKQGLPGYVGEGFAIKLPDSVKGLAQYLTSFGTPIEQFAGLFKQNNILSTISQMNPLLKVPIELGIGKDSFRQKDLKDVYDAKEYKTMPQIVKNLLQIKEVKKNTYKKVGDEYVKTGEYTQYIADPKRLLISRSLFTSRGVTYLDQIFGGDLNGFVKYMRLFTGLKPQEFNIELGKSLKDKDQRRALEDLLIKMGALKEYRNVYEPK